MKYRFHKQVSLIMKDAANEAKDMGNNYVGSEHVLLALLKDTTTNFAKILAKQGIYYYQLKEDLMVLFGLREKSIKEIQVTQVVDDILERSHKQMQEQKQNAITADMLALALLKTDSCVANEILLRYDVDLKELQLELGGSETSELDKIAELRNLNTCKNNRDIVGRNQELELMISVLSRKEKANPLLIGEPGVGKTALVEKLAGMIAEKQVSEEGRKALSPRYVSCNRHNPGNLTLKTGRRAEKEGRQVGGWAARTREKVRTDHQAYERFKQITHASAYTALGCCDYTGP